MNIILLSGGSGKRLWPLSNDIRSKQFIKLFKTADGKDESMVQRVYRQLASVDSEASVTIATSKSQVSSIHNQLGDKVSVCIEPCRRDTFPAIVLVAAYLHDVQGISEEECVAVCPVDPYVDDSYYECVKQLEEVVLQDKANITLMGIEPTYPSEKYGYIIPMGTEHISVVKEFKEKPDIATAEKYIAQGALWNAGVFAFRLGYLIQKAHSMIDFTDYNDLYSKYDQLEKISFDYAVVEKESSIQVLRYAGDWKDVGTWNTMTEVMENNTFGNATTDNSCQNLHVINELDIPILCMGCKDMVIAASCDGILVADKEQSNYMKSYVDKISVDVRYAEKSWGDFKIVDVENNSITIKLTIYPNQEMTYHSHEFRDEIWTILSGEGIVVIDGEKQFVHGGDVINIPAKCKHSIKAKRELKVLETQLGENICVEDKIKYPLFELDKFKN